MVPLQLPQRPRICAHAGCEGQPLDGLEAIEAGIHAGADIVELDLRFDHGVAVLAHDRLGRQTRNRVTLDQALEVLARYASVEINIDVKEPDALARYSTPLTRGEVVNPVYCTGLKGHQIADFRVGCPTLRCTVDDLPWWFGWASKQARVDHLRRWVDQGLLALNLSYRLVHEALMEASVCAGMPVRVWTVDDVPTMDKMVALGVEAITTNRVSVLRGRLG